MESNPSVQFERTFSDRLPFPKYRVEGGVMEEHILTTIQPHQNDEGLVGKILGVRGRNLLAGVIPQVSPLS